MLVGKNKSRFTVLSTYRLILYKYKLQWLMIRIIRSYLSEQRLRNDWKHDIAERLIPFYVHIHMLL